MSRGNSIGLGASTSGGSGMGPKPPKDQPFGDYRLQWNGRP